MTKYSYERATMALDATPLGPLNRRFANYWLSLWDGDNLPSRSALNPARLRDLLPGVVLLEVRGREAIRCRVAGTAIQQGLGFDITGKDWLAMTPEDQKPVRLHRIDELLAGAGSRNLREGYTVTGSQVCAEEVQFPFADVGEDGSRLLISHVAWRAGSAARGNPQLRDAHHIASHFQPIPLAAA
ncbi:MAG TPA: PAS domain-containing protein [Rhizomicrobium sp.]|jgi:hypothetical protein|nr:PAS domain-containing protein [Rhizomicrobium sp.]